MTEKLSNEFSGRFRSLEENYKEITQRLAEAALASGRKPEDITLLAATKTVPVEVINHGISLGIRHIGENRVQEFCGKYENLLPCDRQFIGRLQTNKVKYLIGKVSMIQSVDSEKLAREISRLSQAGDAATDILVEVNIGREANKSGVMPEELWELMEKISLLPAVRVRGLMAIPPAEASMTETSGYFSKMYDYFVDSRAKKIDNIAMEYLSMGMSDDYAQAVRCGANLVRVGSALFGARGYQR